MKTRDKHESREPNSEWLHGQLWDYGADWLADWCHQTGTPIGTEHILETLDEPGVVTCNDMGDWDIVVGEASIPVSLPKLVDAATQSDGHPNSFVPRFARRYKDAVAKKTAARLASLVEDETPAGVERDAAEVLEHGIDWLVQEEWEKIGAVFDYYTDCFYLASKAGESYVSVSFDVDEATRMVKAARPGLFRLVDGAITTVGGAA